MMIALLLAALEEELRADFHKALAGLLTTARTRLEGALAEVAKERAQGLAEVATQKAELHREIEAMQTHQSMQEGHVELNIGGFHFETSVQTLRRVPHTFFDAYFSGRYAQDVCRDGSIFVDRDGEHFGHVLEYMRDGMVAVAEPGAQPSVSLLRALKREFGFYCIDLGSEQPAELHKLETAYVMGGRLVGHTMLSMERYDASSEQWSAVASMATARAGCGACVIAGDIYVTGGLEEDNPLSSMERYSPSNDVWTNATPMPDVQLNHASVAVGLTMYVVGGTQMDVFKYDSTECLWSRGAPIPDRRVACAACAVGSNIYVFGGFDDHNFPQTSVFKYDTVLDTWNTITSMPQICIFHNAVEIDGLVFIVGAGGDGCQVLRFNPESEVWDTLSPTLGNRQGGASFLLSGCLYVAGGARSGASVERYDIATDTWSEVADMLERRGLQCAVVIGSSKPAEPLGFFDNLIFERARAFMPDE
jgi:hypothetical protein